jgi:hypothetical protein
LVTESRETEKVKGPESAPPSASGSSFSAIPAALMSGLLFQFEYLLGPYYLCIENKTHNQT